MATPLNLNPQRIIAHQNILVNLQFPAAGGARPVTSQYATLYCSFIPDEILVHQPFAMSDDLVGNRDPVQLKLFSNIFNTTSGYLGHTYDAGREPMRILYPPGQGVPVNGTYNFQIRTSFDAPFQVGFNIEVWFVIECIRYETPGRPRE